MDSPVTVLEFPGLIFTASLTEGCWSLSAEFKAIVTRSDVPFVPSPDMGTWDGTCSVVHSLSASSPARVSLGFADIDGEMLENGAITSDDSTIVTGFSGLSAVVINDVCRMGNGKADPSNKLPPPTWSLDIEYTDAG